MDSLLTEELIENTYLYCWKRMSNKEEAQDVAQEIVVDAMIILRSGKNIENFYGLYWTIARNKVADFYRRKKPVKVSLDDVENQLLGFDKSLGDYIRQEEMDNLSKSMNHLAAIHRDILVRFYVKEQSVKEISSALSIPIGTVTKRLSDARKKLKEDYENMESDHLESQKNSKNNKVFDLEINYYGQCFDESMAILGLLEKQILFLCRNKPKSVGEIVKQIDAAPAFVEASIKLLQKADLLYEPENMKGKLLTDFVILENSIYRKALQVSYKLENEMQLAKRYIDIINGMKDEILSENFYGNDLPWEYLLPYFIIRSDRHFRKNMGSEYLRERYFKGYPERKWRYGFECGFYEDEENYEPKNIKKKIIGPGYSYNHHISIKYGHFEVHPVIETMDYSKDGKKYELNSERLGWINASNIDVYRKIVERPDEQLDYREEEILADFISKGIIEKKGQKYRGTIPMIPFNVVEKWEKIWDEKFKSLAEEYAEASYQLQKDTVLKSIRKNLQWASVCFSIFPVSFDLDSLLMQYAIDNNLVRFEEGLNASCASIVILVE